MRRHTRTSRGLLLILTAVGAFLMLFPFLWTVVTSITPDGTLATGPTLWVENPTLDNYRRVFDSMPVWRIVGNSFFVAIAVTASQLITSFLAAYGFSRIPFPGKSLLFGLYLTTLMIPMQVLVVPLFIQMTQFKLNDTLFALIAPSIASAFGVFLVRQAVDGVPRDLDEAATIDGAGHLRIAFGIVLPLVRPALATLAVFAFMSSWNSFLWPLVVIRSPELQTLPLALANLQGRFTTDWSVMMAGSVLSIIPIALVYIVAQRYIIAGFAHTGIK